MTCVTPTRQNQRSTDLIAIAQASLQSQPRGKAGHKECPQGLVPGGICMRRSGISPRYRYRFELKSALPICIAGVHGRGNASRFRRKVLSVGEAAGDEGVRGEIPPRTGVLLVMSVVPHRCLLPLLNGNCDRHAPRYAAGCCRHQDGVGGGLLGRCRVGAATTGEEAERSQRAQGHH